MLTNFKKEFGNIAPIGYIMRDSGINCIRIHNFPNKRYPEDIKDNKQLLQFYKKLLNELCQNTNLTCYINFYDLGIHDLENTWLDKLDLKFLDNININPTENEPYFVKTYLCKINNDSNDFEKMILDIANEEFDGSVTFYCNYKHNLILISPYPGGVDIFIKRNILYDDIKKKLLSDGVDIKECP